MTSAENLVAAVEGNIAEKDGVLKIIHIRLKYQFKIPTHMKEKRKGPWPFIQIFARPISP